MAASTTLVLDEKALEAGRPVDDKLISAADTSTDRSALSSRDATAADAVADPGDSDTPPPAGPGDNDNDSTTAPQEAEAQRTKFETTLIIASLMAALFLAALDVSIVATIVPTVAQEFQSSTGYVWIGSAFLLGNAACVPTWGKISDIWGRKPILLAALGVFWVGSLLCGVAVNMAMLIAGRAVQGVGGGGVIVLVNICISDLFSLRERGVYFGIVGIVWAIASAVGPVVGGILTSKVTWRWCFYINLPICGVGIIVLFFVLKLHNPRTPVVQGLRAIDWLGSLIIVGGTVMFLFGLEFGGVVHPWNSPTVVCLIVFGVVMIGIFILVELRFAKYPIVPMHLFSNRSNIAVFATSFGHAFIFIAGSYWLPLYFQAVLGADALFSGVYLLPYVISLSVVAAISGFVIRKFDNYYYLIAGGMLIATIGFGLFNDLPPDRNFTKIIIYQIVAGIGIGPNFQSPLIALQTNVKPNDIGSATGTYSFIRQIGTSVSVVIGGVVFGNRMDAQQPRLIAELGSEIASMLSGSSAASKVGLLSDLPDADRAIARGAYAQSIRTMYAVYVAIGGLGFIASLFIAQKSLSKDHKEHKTGLKTLRSRERQQPVVDQEKV
ncbi:major facilitator superfamily domain-containing protein [Plectosphaerella cucumerina]|uniref:Efflux pump dotC n=1 Tax=Plectosphaerella cucumerina TaxID=40658 RepID=A0A8K0TG92_9PEZI|nr:major facilitator superfamily domain-containing protein [Plectosphaerella cucumerina]